MNLRPLALAALCALSPAVHAVSPIADPDFGSVGWTSLFESGGGSQDEYAVAHARTADGGWVVALELPGGGANNGNGKRIGLFRLDANGQQVSSGFGTFGAVYKDAWLTSVTDMALDSQGRIVVVGATPGPGGMNDFGVVRFNPDGSDDTSFAGDGGTAVGFDVPGINADDTPTSVLIDSGDKIVVAGNWWVSGFSSRFGAVRLNVDGAVDDTWGSIDNDQGGRRGSVADFVDGMAAYAQRILRIDQGFYVITGTSAVGNNDTDFAACILGTTGQEFANHLGCKTFAVNLPGPGGSLFDTLGDAVLVNPTTILLVGSSSGSIAATRIKVGIAPGGWAYTQLDRDPAFIGTPNESAPNTFIDDTPHSIGKSAAVAPNGQMLLVGDTTDNSPGLAEAATQPDGTPLPRHGLLLQLNANGQSDASFGYNGKAYFDHPFGNGYSYLTQLQRVSYAGSQPVIIGSSSFSSSSPTDMDGFITRLYDDAIFANGFESQF